MRFSFSRLLAVAAGALVLGWTGALAQDAAGYPARPVRFIVPASAGGGTDALARMVATPLGQALGQSVVVDNRPGAGQMLGANLVAKAEPDGYTMLFTTSTPTVILPVALPNVVPYNVQRDFTVVSYLGASPLVLYVNTVSPVKNLRELLDFVKSRPEQANFGSYGNGSSGHLMMEYFLKRTVSKWVHVPFNAVAPQLQSLAGAQILTAVADIGAPAGLVAAGKIRPIAITGARRSPLMPEVETFAEQGYAGMEPFSPWYGLFAPKKTSKAMVESMAARFAKVVHTAEFRAKLVAFGIDPSDVTSPAHAEQLFVADVQRWQGIVRELPDVKFE